MSEDKIQDGGPAFPALPEHGVNDGEPGMTLRDFFAANATDGDVEEVMISYMRAAQRDGIIPAHVTRAQARYLHADAMIKAREVAHD